MLGGLDSSATTLSSLVFFRAAWCSTVCLVYLCLSMNHTVLVSESGCCGEDLQMSPWHCEPAQGPPGLSLQGWSVPGLQPSGLLRGAPQPVPVVNSIPMLLEVWRFGS